MIGKDEKWHIVPPIGTRLWSISIRNKDGSYRQPTRDELELLLEIYEAARAYGESEHVLNSNHFAGDCDECSAKAALAALDALIGGPRLTSES